LIGIIDNFTTKTFIENMAEIGKKKMYPKGSWESRLSSRNFSRWSKRSLEKAGVDPSKPCCSIDSLFRATNTFIDTLELLNVNIAPTPPNDVTHFYEKAIHCKRYKLALRYNQSYH